MTRIDSDVNNTMRFYQEFRARNCIPNNSNELSDHLQNILLQSDLEFEKYE